MAGLKDPFDTETRRRLLESAAGGFNTPAPAMPAYTPPQSGGLNMGDMPQVDSDYEAKLRAIPFAQPQPAAEKPEEPATGLLGSAWGSTKEAATALKDAAVLLPGAGARMVRGLAGLGAMGVNALAPDSEVGQFAESFARRAALQNKDSTEYWKQYLSPESVKAMETEILTNAKPGQAADISVPLPEFLGGGDYMLNQSNLRTGDLLRKFLMMGAESAPATVGGMAIGAKIAGGLAGAAGLSGVAEAGMTAGQRAAMTGINSLAYGGSEGLMAASANATDVYGQIADMPMDQLRKVPVFALAAEKVMRENPGMSREVAEETARTQIARDSGLETALTSGLSTAAFGAPFGNVSSMLAGGLARAVGRGNPANAVSPYSFGKGLAIASGSEAFQEGLQSPLEAYSANLALANVDPELIENPYRGVGEAALSGLVLGGAMGGGMHTIGAAARRYGPQPPEQATPPESPAAGEGAPAFRDFPQYAGGLDQARPQPQDLIRADQLQSGQEVDLLGGESPTRGLGGYGSGAQSGDVDLILPDYQRRVTDFLNGGLGGLGSGVQSGAEINNGLGGYGSRAENIPRRVLGGSQRQGTAFPMPGGTDTNGLLRPQAFPQTPSLAQPDGAPSPALPQSPLNLPAAADRIGGIPASRQLPPPAKAAQETAAPKPTEQTAAAAQSVAALPAELFHRLMQQRQQDIEPARSAQMQQALAQQIATGDTQAAQAAAQVLRPLANLPDYRETMDRIQQAAMPSSSRRRGNDAAPFSGRQENGGGLLQAVRNKTDMQTLLRDYGEPAIQQAIRDGLIEPGKNALKLTQAGKRAALPVIRKNLTTDKAATVKDSLTVAPESAPQKDIPVMTEDDYLNSKGAYFMGGAEPALHRTPGGFPSKGSNSRDSRLERVHNAMDANNKRREELRVEYARLISEGKIRKPTAREELLRKASGEPSNESVQAARRLLKRKFGIDYEATTENAAATVRESIVAPAEQATPRPITYEMDATERAEVRRENAAATEQATPPVVKESFTPEKNYRRVNGRLVESPDAGIVTIKEAGGERLTVQKLTDEERAAFAREGQKGNHAVVHARSGEIVGIGLGKGGAAKEAAKNIRQMVKKQGASFPEIASGFTPITQPETGGAARQAESAPKARTAIEGAAKTAEDVAAQLAERSKAKAESPRLSVAEAPTEKPVSRYEQKKAEREAQAAARKKRSSELAKARRKVNTKKDDLLAAIAKLGGLSWKETAAQYGWSVRDKRGKVKNVKPEELRNIQRGIYHVFTEGGASFDSMAETLSQYGYPVHETSDSPAGHYGYEGDYSVNALHNAVRDALNGKQVFTQEGFEEYESNKQRDKADADGFDVEYEPLIPDGVIARTASNPDSFLDDNYIPESVISDFEEYEMQDSQRIAELAAILDSINPGISESIFDEIPDSLEPNAVVQFLEEKVREQSIERSRSDNQESQSGGRMAAEGEAGSREVSTEDVQSQTSRRDDGGNVRVRAETVGKDGQVDAFGGKTETQQALADRNAAIDRKLGKGRAQPSLQAGAGAALFGGNRQTDIEDMAGVKKQDAFGRPVKPRFSRQATPPQLSPEDKAALIAQVKAFSLQKIPGAAVVFSLPGGQSFKIINTPEALKQFREWVAADEAGKARMSVQASLFEATQASLFQQRKAEAKRKGITAWHGSPHTFDKFTTAKMGTGEGHQVYGWGMYFTENRTEVAESYRDGLSARNKEYKIEFGGSEYDYKSLYQMNSNDNESPVPGVSIRTLLSIIRVGNVQDAVGNSGWTAELSRARELVKSGVMGIKSVNTGRLYQVNLNAAEDEFLDWDKPYSQQSKKVKNAVSGRLREIFESSRSDDSFDQWLDNPSLKGHLILSLMTKSGDAKDKSIELRSRGIKGIKYVGEFQRTKGKGATNYVIFQDDDIEIIQRLSKQKRGAGGLSKADAEKLIRPVTSQWGDAGTRVRVVQTQAELAEALPHVQGLQSAAGAVEGLYDPKSRAIYLVADNLNADRILPVLAHEAVGHYAAENFIHAPEYRKALDAVARLEAAGDKSVVRWLEWVDATQPGLPADVRAMEALAQAVESGEYKNQPAIVKVVNTIINLVKKALSALGFNNAWIQQQSRADLLNMLRTAEARMRQSRGQVVPDATYINSQAEEAPRVLAEDMPSREALETAYLNNPLNTKITGLNAYHELLERYHRGEKGVFQKAQVSIDVDDLGGMNSVGMKFADELLIQFGDTLKRIAERESGGAVQVIHLHGDEFFVQGPDTATVNRAMNAARAEMARMKFETVAEYKDGKNTVRIPWIAHGLNFGWGVQDIGAGVSPAQALRMADNKLNMDKANRRAKGYKKPKGLKTDFINPAELRAVPFLDGNYIIRGNAASIEAALKSGLLPMSANPFNPKNYRAPDKGKAPVLWQSNDKMGVVIPAENAAAVNAALQRAAGKFPGQFKYDVDPGNARLNELADTLADLGKAEQAKSLRAQFGKLKPQQGPAKVAAMVELQQAIIAAYEAGAKEPKVGIPHEAPHEAMPLAGEMSKAELRQAYLNSPTERETLGKNFFLDENAKGKRGEASRLQKNFAALGVRDMAYANDNTSHATGDAMIQAFARKFREVGEAHGIELIHIGGGDFYAQHERGDKAALDKFLRDTLPPEMATVVLEDFDEQGTPWKVQGLQFDYQIGTASGGETHAAALKRANDELSARKKAEEAEGSRIGKGQKPDYINPQKLSVPNLPDAKGNYVIKGNPDAIRATLGSLLESYPVEVAANKGGLNLQIGKEDADRLRDQVAQMQGSKNKFAYDIDPDGKLAENYIRGLEEINPDLAIQLAKSYRATKGQFDAREEMLGKLRSAYHDARRADRQSNQGNGREKGATGNPDSGLDTEAAKGSATELRAGSKNAGEGKVMGMLSRLFGKKLPLTLDVDGIERPAYDSEGEALGKTEEDVVGFWRWFGNSRAVDSEGRPLVVYHGTPNGGFSEFETDRKTVGSGQTVDVNAAMGAHFTEAKYVAERFMTLYGKGANPMLYRAYIRASTPLFGGDSWVSPAEQRKAEAEYEKKLKQYRKELAIWHKDKSGLSNEEIAAIIEKHGVDAGIEAMHRGKSSPTPTPPEPVTMKRRPISESALIEKSTGMKYEAAASLPGSKRIALGKKAKAGLKSQGYDSVLYNNSDPAESGEMHTPTWIIFDNKNIRIKQNFNPSPDTEKLGDNQKGRFSFAGQNAETANLDDLAVAARMLEAGEDADFVRKETGWFKGADGKWRFEIDDSKAEYTPPGGKNWTANLGDVLKHDRLFAAYPALRDIIVQGDGDMDSRMNGAVETTPSGKTMIRLNTSRMEIEQQSTLLHEIQHGIQNIEGFAVGGSPFDFTNPLRWIPARIGAAINIAAEIKRINKFIATAYGYPRIRFDHYNPDKFYKKIIDRNPPMSQTEFMASSRVYGDKTKDELYDVIKQLMLAVNPYESYQRLAGEVEARNVQARMGMSEAQRLKKSPAQTQDIPDSEVIIRWNGRDMQASVSDPLPYTIDVDGVTRPTRNSNGQPIHPTAEGVRNFWRWFGDSKVVDDQGRPLVVYHGTGADFEKNGIVEFDPLKFGTGTDEGWFGKGFYFTPSALTASEYANRGAADNVMPLYLRIESPFDWRNEKGAGMRFGSNDDRYIVTRDIVGSGHDGVFVYDDTIGLGESESLSDEQWDMLTNHYDNKGIKIRRDLTDRALRNNRYKKGEFIERYGKKLADSMPTFRHLREIVAFYPNQIKSALGNTGQFSPDSNDIRFSIRDPELDAPPTPEGQRGLLARVFDPARNFAGDKLADWRPTALGAFTLRQLADMYGKVIKLADNTIKGSRKIIISKGSETPEKNYNGKGKPDIFYQTDHPVEDYDALVHRMDADAARLMQEADAIAEDWANLDPWLDRVRGNPANRREVETLMAEGTYYQVYPNSNVFIPIKDNTPEFEAKRKQKHRELRARFAALPQPAQDVYNRAEKKFREHYNAMKDALVNRIMRSNIDGLHKKELADKIRDQFEQAMSIGPYFPFMRPGEYVVQVFHDPDERGNTSSFYAFESRREARRFTNAEKLKGRRVVEGVKLSDVAQSDISANFVSDVMGLLGTDQAAKDQLYQLYLQYMPDLSGRKNFIHRQFKQGWNPAMLRSYSSTMFHSAKQIARVRFGDLLERQLGLMEAAYNNTRNGSGETDDLIAAGHVINEMRLRHEQIMNPPGAAWAYLANNLGFLWHLAGSPAAGLVNMSATPMVALPTIAAAFPKVTVNGKERDGFAVASSMLLEASKQFVVTTRKAEWRNGFASLENSKDLNKDESAAMKEAIDEGHISKTQSHDLAGRADDAGKFGTHDIITRINAGLGYMFHHTERANREITFLVGYRMARAAGHGHREAINQSLNLMYASHGDYSSNNRARYMRGNVARVITQFKAYSQFMTYLWGRGFRNAFYGESPEVKTAARRQLFGMAFMTGSMAGLLGLPMVTTVLGLLSAVAAGLSDDDEPVDLENDLRVWLAQNVGAKNAEMILKGVPRGVIPADLHSRIGQQSLWLRESDKELEGHDWFAYYLEQLLGPSAGMAGRMTDGFRMFLFKGLMQGDAEAMQRGAEIMAPKFIADPLKAYRYNTEGIRSMSSGDMILEPTTVEQLLKLSGFAPARYSELIEARTVVKEAEKAIQKTRQKLVSKYWTASRFGDEAERRKVVEEIKAFNLRNKTWPITGATIQSSFKARIKAGQKMQDGYIVNPKLAYLREKGSFLAE